MHFVALKMLMGDTSKYIGVIFGITFATLIMTQQPAIFVGIMTRTYSFISDIPYPKLWIMDEKVQFVDDVKPLQDTQLTRVRGVEGVDWAVPLYKGMLRARTEDGNFQNCILVGLDDATLIGAPGTLLTGKIENLRQSNGIIVDSDGARLLARKLADGTTRPLQIGDTIEINDKVAVVVGIAKVTRSFQTFPVIFTTYTRALIFSPQQRLMLSFILAGLKTGYAVDTVSAKIKAHTGLAAYTETQFKKMTENYFMKNTGIPINFGTSVLLGFLVGAAIAGQMFYNFTQENIKQFGVLKAMGTSNVRLVKMIILQACLVGITGWGIGIGLASIFGYATKGTVLAFRMSWQVLLLSASGVLIIVSIAALISVRKVLALEPAIVFKG